MKVKKNISKLWKSDQIETKVFIRWINHHLESPDDFIKHLKPDLINGFQLIFVIEKLSRKKTNCSDLILDNRQSQILYIDRIIDFLTSEKVSFPNIESRDIVDGSIQKIKDLIWSIVFHYSIRNRLIEIDQEKNSRNFLKWLNSKLDGYIIENFTTAWNSGIALGVLLNTCDKDICTDALSWNAQYALNNSRFAMEAALKCFSVPQILRPNEIVDPNINERTIITYIGPFIDLIQDKNNDKYDTTGKFLSSVVEDCGNTSLLFAALPNDNSMDVCQKYFQIKVDERESLNKDDRICILITTDEDKTSFLNKFVVEAVDLKGIVLPCSHNSEYCKDKEMQFSFLPNASTSFDIIIRDQRQKYILNKPFQINVESESAKQTIVPYGPGLHLSIIGHPSVFILETNGSDKQIAFSMEGPSKTKIECTDIGDGCIKINYWTLIPGLYQLAIVANNVNICESPYQVNVLASKNIPSINKVKVIGLKNLNLRSFIIDSRNTEYFNPPNILCYDKSGSLLAEFYIDILEKQCYQINLKLDHVRRYIIFADYENLQIDGFPHLIHNTVQDDHVDTIENSFIFQEKCLNILNQDLVDAIELSVRDLCIDTLNEEMFKEHNPNESDNCISDILSNSAESINDKTKRPSKSLHKWKDKKFGLTLLGRSLQGVTIKKGEQQKIIIDFKHSFQEGELGLALEGPGETRVECIDKGNGKCIIKYRPMIAGQYELIVNFNEQPIDGSPFFIFVTETSETVISQSPKFEESNFMTDKKNSTLSICNETSLSKDYLNSDEKVLKQSEVQLDLVDKITKDDLEKDSIRKSPENTILDESDSVDTLSNTSNNSILSGIYKAKVRKLSMLKNQIVHETEKTLLCKSKSEKFSEYSNSSSTSMEIERISQNYNESLVSFYENMLSAFTNLLAIEIVFSSVEQIANTSYLKNSSDKNSSKRTFIKSFDTDCSFTNLSENCTPKLSNSSKEITSVEYSPQRTINIDQTKTKSFPVKKKDIESYDNNSRGDIVKKSLTTHVDESSVKFEHENRISSYEDIKKNRNLATETYSQSFLDSVYASPTEISQNFDKNVFGKSKDLETGTEDTGLFYEECYKSIGVDIASSTFSPQDINKSINVLKTSANAEVIFDSSPIESKRSFDYISVFNKVAVTDFDISKNCHLNNYSDNFSSITNDSITSPENFNGWDIEENNYMERDSNLSSSEDISSSIKTQNYSYHSSLNKNETIRNHSLIDENLVSCHSICIPIHTTGKIKKKNNQYLIENIRCKATSGTESMVNCLTEVIQSSRHNPGYNIAEKTIFCKDLNRKDLTKLFFEDNQLISSNYYQITPFEEGVDFFVVIDIPVKEFRNSILLENCQVKNIASSIISVLNFHQSKCVTTPLVFDKNCQANLNEIENLNLDEFILTDAIYKPLSQLIWNLIISEKEHSHASHRRNKRLELKERSAQTSHFIIDPITMTDISSLDHTRKFISRETERKNNTHKEPIDILEHNRHCSLEKETFDNIECNNKIQNGTITQEASSNESQDISSAVETLVDAITDIAKNHLILYPSKCNIKRIEELIVLLPRLLKFGKEKCLYQINYLTDKLEMILLKNNDQNSKKALSQIIKSIKKCVSLNIKESKNRVRRHELKRLCEISKIVDEKEVTKNHFDITEEKTNVPSQVHIFGDALHKGFTNFDNKFVVYAAGKMPKNLSICIEGPSKAEISFMDQKIGIFIVCYRVPIPGEYLCSISFDQIHIPQSPFKIIITKNKSISNQEEEQKLESHIPTPHKTKNNQFVLLPIGRNVMFHIHYSSLSILNCFVTEPNQACSYVPIRRISSNSDRDGVLNLFTSLMGIYNLDFYNTKGEKIGDSLRLNVTNFQGGLKSSIIHCNVNLDDQNPNKTMKLTEVNQHIYAFGDGLEQAKVNQKNYFFIFVGTRSEKVSNNEPSLDVTIDGPSKVDISCLEENHGYTFCYIPVIPGIYFIGIRYSNEFHIPGSPFKVVVIHDK